MATKVSELHRYNAQAVDAQPLAERVTIRSREEILPAAKCLARDVRASGLRLMIWHDLATLDPMMDADGHPLNSDVFGWSAAELKSWQCHEAALHNPVFRAARLESEPFRIDRDGLTTRWANPLLARIALDDFAKRTGTPAAIVVPVHLPFGQIGTAVITGLDISADHLGDAFAHVADQLATAIRRFVRGYVIATRDERYAPCDSMLSPREIECLSWIAQGKTDHEIGIILGCSHAGVRYHITRACQRLGALNRAQAVFRAGILGLVGPFAR